MIFSCFAGMGKSTLALESDEIIDLESSDYQWLYTKEGLSLPLEERKNLDCRVLNPDFPQNYIDAMCYHSGEKDSTVLISSQPDVLDLLNQHSIDFCVVTPVKTLKYEYIKRYIDRGNNSSFVSLMETNFDAYVDSMLSNKKAQFVITETQPNMYLGHTLRFFI